MSSQQQTAPDRGPDSEQPGWRHGFPIDWPQDHYVARRDFTKFMILTSMAFAAGQFWIGVENFFRKRRGELPIRRIANVDQIPIGGSLTFNYPAEHDSCVIVRTSQSAFVAFSQKCTHLSCAVVPEPDKGRFLCPCHKGFFDLMTGRPVAGPPRRQLPRIKLEFRYEEIYAAGIEVKT